MIKTIKKPINWKKVSTIALGIMVGLLLLGALIMSILFAWISRDLPDPNNLITRDIPLTTKILDRSGQHILYEIHGDENRTVVQIKELPNYVAHASVAIEDKDFYNHHGISWKGLLRAFVLNTLQGKRIQGTSTLTQQLVKNAILTNERSVTRKIKEILLSLQLERVFTKDQILQLYLNEIPYGSTTYGIEAAAHNYFGKNAKDLTLDEAALLSALPQAPDLYSPYGTGSHGDNRQTLVGRQHYILDLMADQGYVSRKEADDAKAVDTLKKIVPKKISNISAPHFVMYVRSLLEEKYGVSDVERKGYTVLTTLDWDKQLIAEDEVKKGVEKYGPTDNFTNGALLALDPKTGQVLSMVGSKDFTDNAHDGQVNVTLRPRQPGSSFKPIVYAAGLIKGYTADTTLWDVNTRFKTDSGFYEPKNYSFNENGPVSVRMALQGSLNIPAVKMLYLVGVSRVLDFAESMGYSTFGQRNRFGLSLVLGGGEVKLIDHANAYAAFANEGTQYPIASILKVTDAQGKTLEEWTKPEGKQVMDKTVAQRISDILSDNNARGYVFGTHSALQIPGRPAAAKSGTTNNFHDAWTMGYTPSLVAGVWVGNNDNSEMKRGADGSKIAAPIWQAFMKRALDGTPVEKFTPPPPEDTTKPILLGKVTEIKLNIDKVTGKLATEFTPADSIEEKTFHQAHDTLYYLDKDDPRGPAPTHPENDPQFTTWENAVQDWVKRKNWNTTSTPPTESDDVHTKDGQPSVTINNPSANATISSRAINVSASASGQRRVVKVKILCEGKLIGEGTTEPWNIQLQFPNSIERGFHDLTFVAVDDVGNQGSATVTINLTADIAPVSAAISSPATDSKITSGNLPMNVAITMSDVSLIKKIDLYLVGNDGVTRLIASSFNPTDSTIELQWSSSPGTGAYSMYPVITEKNNNIHKGETINLQIIN